MKIAKDLLLIVALFAIPTTLFAGCGALIVALAGGMDDLLPADEDPVRAMAEAESEEGDLHTLLEQVDASDGPELRQAKASALLIAGRGAAEADDTDRALAHLTLAASLDPDNAEVHLALADVLVAAGKEPEAAAHYRRYLALEPDTDDADALRALVTAFEADQAESEAGVAQPATLHDVILVSAGTNAGAVAPVVALASGLGPEEARAVVDSSPVALEHAVPQEVAEILVEELQQAGATAVAKPTGPWEGLGAMSRLAPEPINGVIREREAKLAACLKKKNGGLPPGEQEVVVALLISKNGKAKVVRVSEPEALIDTPAGKCLVTQLKRMRFPKNDVASRIDRHVLGSFSTP